MIVFIYNSCLRCVKSGKMILIRKLRSSDNNNCKNSIRCITYIHV